MIRGSTAVTAPPRELVVWRWLGAFNDHDLEAILACMAPDVRFEPLRLRAGTQTYDGHEGVRRWYRELTRVDPYLRIAVHDIGETGSDQVLAHGAIGPEGCPEEHTPFSAVHTVAGDQIDSARHYLTDSALLDWLGGTR